MTTIALIPKVSSEPQCRVVNTVWKHPQHPSHEFLAAIYPDDGGYSVVVPQYPGIVSQGDSIDEAKANIADAFKAMLEASRKRGRNLEIADAQTFPPDCEKVWIRVDG